MTRRIQLVADCDLACDEPVDSEGMLEFTVGRKHFELDLCKDHLEEYWLPLVEAARVKTRSTATPAQKPCPECGRDDIPTEAGMTLHRARMHGVKSPKAKKAAAKRRSSR